MATGLRLSRLVRHVWGSRCERSWRVGLGVARVVTKTVPVVWPGVVKNESLKGIVNGEKYNERGCDESSRRELRRPIAANRFEADCDKSSRDLLTLTVKSGDSTEKLLGCSDIRNLLNLWLRVLDFQRNSHYSVFKS